MNIILYILILTFIMFFINIIHYNYLSRNEYNCRNISKINYSNRKIINIFSFSIYIKSKVNYITFLSNKSTKIHFIKNNDYDNYSLSILKNAFITDKVIIYKCKIILFNGQCNDNKWYENKIKENEIIPIVKYGIYLINWHSDGVFHGTVEGLTRIIPYIDYLQKRQYINIFISFPRYKQNTAESLLILLGFSKRRILYGKYFVNNLYIPLPYYCVQSSTPLIVKFNEILRERMKLKMCRYSFINYILIIQRTKNRIIDNIDILENELLKISNYTIIIYNDSYSNLNEIYCWFTHAKIIIGYHGSGLTNIYFSKEKTIVVELSPKHPIYAFAKIGSQLGLKYYIYKLPYNKLYIQHISFNISSFINTLKRNNIIK